MKPARPAKDYALWLLSRRAYSEKEIRQRLAKKEYSQQEIDDTVVALVNLKLINDQQLAAFYVKDRVKIYRRGRWRIKKELLKKGIDSTLIDQELAELTAEEELSAAVSLLKSRAKRLERFDSRQILNRQIGLLSRSGFNSSIIKQALAAFKKESGDRE